jgi:hypothetical protein
VARVTDPHPAGAMFVSEMIERHGRFTDGDELAAS